MPRNQPVCSGDGAEGTMTNWKRRRVWWFTRLQNGRWVEPGTVVEYENIVIDFCGWMLGSPRRWTNYRLPQCRTSRMLKGDRT